MKLGTVIPYLEKIQKYVSHVIRFLSSTDMSIFFTENQQFLVYQEISV